jgi:8-oxo-dGTP pyrophosphatase MutT (NUDIX family)
VSIINDRGHILLGKDAEMGFWTLPGGAIDPEEHPADAAVRECFEETGFLIAIKSLVGVFGGPEFLVRYPNGDISSYTAIAFEGAIIDHDRRAGDGEMTEIGFFSPSDCERLTVANPSRLIVKSTFDRQSQPLFRPPTWSGAKPEVKGNLG